MMSMKELAERFAAGFPSQRSGARTLGRESEFLVVDEHGEAADCAELLPEIASALELTFQREGELIVGAEGPELSASLEVGRGTFEWITRPCRDLHEIRALTERGLQALRGAAHARGWTVVGTGIQPVTPARAEGMTGKERYGLLLQVLGASWLDFSVTASEQLHVSLERGEAIEALETALLLTPALISFTANSPIGGARDLGVCSGREWQMGRIQAGAGRHGLPLRPARSWLDLIEQLSDLDLLLWREDGALRTGQGSFRDFFERGAGWEDFLLHEHYIWHSARLRSQHGTIEWRAACQQPLDDSMVPAALCLGWTQVHRSLRAWLRDQLGPELWPAARRWHAASIRSAMAAPAPCEGILRELLVWAERGLSERGFGEERYLEGAWARLTEQRSPAQRSREAFGRGGLPGLLEQLQGAGA